jgi:hypothetical protein
MSKSSLMKKTQNERRSRKAGNDTEYVAPNGAGDFIGLLNYKYVAPTALKTGAANPFASSASPVRGEIFVENAPKIRKSPVRGGIV